jgi:hypothetical protein
MAVPLPGLFGRILLLLLLPPPPLVVVAVATIIVLSVIIKEKGWWEIWVLSDSEVATATVTTAHG